MKTLFRMLLPGVIATLSVIIIGAAALSHAQTPVKPSSQAVDIGQVPAQFPQASTSAGNGAPRDSGYTICGVCGARIQQPQAVMVAAAYYDQQPHIDRAAPRPALMPARASSIVCDRDYCEPQPASYCPRQGQATQVVLGADGNYYRVVAMGIPPAPVFDLAGDYERSEPCPRIVQEIPMRTVARRFR